MSKIFGVLLDSRLSHSPPLRDSSASFLLFTLCVKCEFLCLAHSNANKPQFLLAMEANELNCLTEQHSWHHGIAASALWCWAAPGATVAEGFASVRIRGWITAMGNGRGGSEPVTAKRLSKSVSTKRQDLSMLLRDWCKRKLLPSTELSLSLFLQGVSHVFAFLWQFGAPARCSELGASSYKGCLGRREGNCLQPDFAAPPGTAPVWRKHPNQASQSNVDLTRSKNKPL